jgi:hypothetical protein
MIDENASATKQIVRGMSRVALAKKQIASMTRLFAPTMEKIARPEVPTVVCPQPRNDL